MFQVTLLAGLAGAPPPPPFCSVRHVGHSATPGERQIANRPFLHPLMRCERGDNSSWSRGFLAGSVLQDQFSKVLIFFYFHKMTRVTIRVHV